MNTKHNPERRVFKGRSYRKGGRHIRDLRDLCKACDGTGSQFVSADHDETKPCPICKGAR
jgi:hypothetical protein